MSPFLYIIAKEIEFKRHQKYFEITESVMTNMHCCSVKIRFRLSAQFVVGVDIG